MARPRGFSSLGDLAFADLARLIFRQEGSLNADGSWNTSSLGYRFNNPGNLVYAGQPGASPQTAYDPGMGQQQTYAKFDTLENGILATQRQLALDASRGATVQSRFSGPGAWSTANQEAYVRNISSWAGVDPSTPLTQLRSGFPGAPPAAQAEGQKKAQGKPGNLSPRKPPAT